MKTLSNLVFKAIEIAFSVVAATMITAALVNTIDTLIK